MLEFIKMFGLGVLYTILFPFIVIIFAVNLLYSFINYLVMESISIFGFFLGYTFSVDTPLDIKLESMKENNRKEKEVVYEYNNEPSQSEECLEEGSDEQ